MQVTWHLLGMLFWEIYEIFRTGFTRNTHEYLLLQLVVAGKCFNQEMFFRKYIIWFDIQWHVLPGIKCITEVYKTFHDVYLGLYLVCLVHFSLWCFYLGKCQCHEHRVNYSCSSFFKWKSFKKKAGSPW